MPIDLPCTGCRRRLSVRDEFAGRQVRCPACGAMVLAAPPAPPPSGPPLPGYAGPFFAPPDAAADKDERRAWSAVLLSPTRFFSGRGARSTVAQAARVGLPFLLLGAVASSVQYWLMLSRLGPSIADAWKSAGLGEMPLDLNSSFASVLQNQLLMEAAGLVLYPLSLHFGATLVGARGFQKTCSIYLYSLTARVLDLIPLPLPFGLIYLLVLNYLGMRHVHRLSEGRSLVAILLAAVVAAIGLLILFSCFVLLHGISLPDMR